MASTSDYVLPRDYLDNNRYVYFYLMDFFFIHRRQLVTDLMIISINLQHYLWAELFGYLAHPAIPTQDPHLRIADVGTGTG